MREIHIFPFRNSYTYPSNVSLDGDRLIFLTTTFEGAIYDVRKGSIASTRFQGDRPNG